MFNPKDSVFSTAPSIPDSAAVIVVSDMFVEDYVGGAELTTQALIDSSPFEIFKLKSKQVTLDLLRQGASRHWVFGNFAELDPQLIPTIVRNIKYTVLEYDYKYCRFRSPEKHLSSENVPCDCHNQMHGKMVSAFFHGATCVWWMSEKQRQRYTTLFPFLAEKDGGVLSSVFDPRTLGVIMALREANQATQRKDWVVLGSPSWIKGADDAVEWCKTNKKEYEVVWNLSYDQVLAKLASSEGLVYLPRGGDTCPRLVIEAKLLGCQLQLNDNVQHKDEEWFASDNLNDIEDYLLSAPRTFWTRVRQSVDYKPTISGYTTTYNCVKQAYPFEQCIKSMLEFCDEVCVVDGGSTDGTWEHLMKLAAQYVVQDTQTLKFYHRLNLKQVKRDWSVKRHPVFDGMQKAEARAMCTSEFCWQMDSDEVVHEDDGPKIRELCRLLNKDVDIVSLPVIEYWGGPDKVRMDVQPWKWRLSRNKPEITHGIPGSLRRYDAEGQLYASEGTDGCDMIDAATGEPWLHVSFYTQDVENVRRVAMSGSEQARLQYEQWFNQVVNGLPCVFHYSWFNLSRKIRLYRDYWQNHWNALWDKNTDDTSENNLMFGVPWKDVTDEMIEQRAAEMKEKLGGWVWHRPWDGKTTTPHITCNRTQPSVMQ